MSNIVEFAEKRNPDLLITAGKKIENRYSSDQRIYENFLLNHIGGLLGINECEYIEAMQYMDGDLLNPDQEKAMSKLENLSDAGYRKATKYLADMYVSSNPSLALKYYYLCLNDNSVDQGEINEQIGFLYFCCDDLENKDGVPYLTVAADQYNRGFAQYILASMFFYGNGVEKDVDTSYSYCLKAANNGNDDAEFWLGKDYLFANEYPLEKNVELALKYLKRSADQFNKKAQYFLGFIYFDGEYVEKDVELAEIYLTSAIYGEIAEAYSYLGQLNYERADYAEAKEYLEIAHNRFESMLWSETLIKIYKNGLGCSVDIPKAVAVIEDMIAKDLSDKNDVMFAADCYYEGNEVARNIDKAVRYYRMIEDNNPSIKYKLGCIAFDESSNLLSKRDCVRYFEYAGNNGYPDAYSKLAYYFISISNNDRALDYFKRSFKAGNIDDGVMVGRIYEAGTPSMYKNMTEAVNWYKAAAEKGSQKAKNELAHIKSGIFGFKRI